MFFPSFPWFTMNKREEKNYANLMLESVCSSFVTFIEKETTIEDGKKKKNYMNPMSIQLFPFPLIVHERRDFIVKPKTNAQVEKRERKKRFALKRQISLNLM